MLSALLHKHPKLLPLLKEGGADPDSADGYGETALGYSVTNCALEVAAMVLEQGADPNKESLKLLPLLGAASMGMLGHVRVLLSGGAGPNRVQWNGLTPLLQAVRYGYMDVIAVLLKAGTNPAHVGPDGSSSFDLANNAKRSEILSLLREFGSKTCLDPHSPKKAFRRKVP